MYYRENDKVVESDNIENYELVDGGNVSSKSIGLYVLYTILGVVILVPMIFKTSSTWIFETPEKTGLYISLTLLLIITIILLNCVCT